MNTALIRRSTKLWWRKPGIAFQCQASAVQLFSTGSYASKRRDLQGRIDELVEVQQRDKFHRFLLGLQGRTFDVKHANLPSGLDEKSAELLLRAGFGTFLLHVEARVASLIGEGFYTIGPCGEELVGILGLLSRASDPMALHYRHVSVQLARQLASGRPLDQVILDRARSYVCSQLDPVTGGNHCAIGGTAYDFYVTSTLASQAPPAVGRALATRLAPRLDKSKAKFPRDAVSIVSLGDGSVNNGMFLSALNLSKYAQHRGFKCPVLFVVTNNDICISLKGHGYMKKFASDAGVKLFSAHGDGEDLDQLWGETQSAINFVRSQSKPAMLVLDKLPRRFGHAATDRQGMYLSDDEISNAVESNPLEATCLWALKNGLVSSPELLLSWWTSTQQVVEESFQIASKEPKISDREHIVSCTQAPLVPLPVSSTTKDFYKSDDRSTRKLRKKQPMRVLMNQVFKEALSLNSNCVYVGEDVRHGGYYRVTDEISQLFPERIQDFPPDETSLIGIGMGYAQAGLLPIVEIPYAKYLDCAADMFFESIMTHWCTSGKQTNGMVIRLQGFDKGVFGGNFHTHNSLYLPPGLDVVCYSNGVDYVRGMRHALHQASEAGRIVMSVDSTDLLHRRSLFNDEDTEWLGSYPLDTDENDQFMLDFDTVILYGNPTSPKERSYVSSSTSQHGADVVIFSYGNGIPTSLRAAKSIVESSSKSVCVVDCPTLGVVSKGMRTILENNPDAALVFADVCKPGQNPFAATIMGLQCEGILENFKWQCATAAATYNPLGCTLTFLNEDDIKTAARKIVDFATNFN